LPHEAKGLLQRNWDNGWVCNPELYITTDYCARANCIKEHRPKHYGGNQWEHRPQEYHPIEGDYEDCVYCQNCKNSCEENNDTNNFVIARYTKERMFRTNLDLNKVKRDGGTWWVKYGTLFVKPFKHTTNDDILEFDGDDIEDDMKWAAEEEVCDGEECGYTENTYWLSNHEYDKDGFLIDSDED
jgi:hypothetical protein